jgi:putative ATP-dependent endonuclease of the OLD family
MKIEKITIENFRGINEVQKIPFKNFSSIVGRNDAGKSIILHAIASFLDTKVYSIVESDFNDPSMPIVIECKVTDDKLTEIIAAELKSKFKKDDGLDEFLNDVILKGGCSIQRKFKAAGKSCSETSILMKSFDKEGFSNLYKKSDEELTTILETYSITIPPSGTGRNSKLEKIKYIKQHCRTNKIAEKEVWIEDEYKIAEILPEVELFQSDYGLEADTKFKTISVAEIQDFFLEETKEDGSRLSIIEKEIKEKMCEEAGNIKEYMQEYTSSLQKVEINPSIVWKDAVRGVDVSFQFDSDTKLIQMSHKGAGYRRLFMVARFRYLAEKNKGKNVIYLIEEPETFLHPAAQDDLLYSLNELSKESQVIITTHSPVFAGSTNYKSVILCKKNTQSIYETADKVDKHDFIKKIVDELGIKPHYNLVDNFDSILFAESPNDIKFYNILCSKMLGQEISNDEKILCLPCGGDSIDSFINIDYFKRSERNLYLILDSDKHNSEEKQEQQKARREEFNEKGKGSAYLLNNSCIENYYHPRAIERLYSLEEGSLDFFGEDENAQERLQEIRGEKGINMKIKNNFDIYNEMTKEEWEEVVEDDLVIFLKAILAHDSCQKPSLPSEREKAKQNTIGKSIPTVEKKEKSTSSLDSQATLL